MGRSCVSYAQANAGEGRKDLGTGMGERGSKDRLAEAASTKWGFEFLQRRWAVESIFS